MIENCAIATMDGPRHDQGGTEYRSGHVTVTGDRIPRWARARPGACLTGPARACREVRAARLRLVGPELS